MYQRKASNARQYHGPSNSELNVSHIALASLLRLAGTAGRA